MSKQAVADVGGIPEYNSEVCSNLAPEAVRLAMEEWSWQLEEHW
jgi:hypothetical protein